MNEFMKRYVLLGVTVVFLSLSCNKDNFNTTPTLKLKSINGNVIPVKSDFIVQFEFTDKEGDIDDSLYVIRQRLNIRGAMTASPSRYTVPEFPHQTKGEIKVQLDYTLQLTSGFTEIGTAPNYEPDTMMYRFVLKDKANHFSDTVVVGPIFVLRGT